MIDKLNAGSSQAVRTGNIEIVRPLVKSNVQESSSVEATDGTLAGAVKHLVAQGVPIDMNHIRSIRQAIADGQYPLDRTLLAEKMIAFDRSGAHVS